MRRVLSTAFMLTLLSGCIAEKSSEQVLLDACIEGFAAELDSWAKYAGWNLRTAEAELLEIKDIPGDKLLRSQMARFKVLISDFTVKNGFNADVRSIATCSGEIMIRPDGSYEPPSRFLMDFTLNGENFGVHRILEQSRNSQ